MSEAVRRNSHDRAFFLLLTPLAAASLPSLAFCILEMLLWLHASLTRGSVVFHLPAQTFWDHIFSLQSSLFHWIARWNSLATLAATAVFACTLLRPRWRTWTAFALIPYALLLCADFTLRWRTILMP